MWRVCNYRQWKIRKIVLAMLNPVPQKVEWKKEGRVFQTLFVLSFLRY